jgi:PAS domain S-box-containing protein
MDDSADNRGKDRRAMRDLVALAALPAVWEGADERRIAETLGDSLLTTLELDFVYLRFRPGTEYDGLQVGRTARGAMPDSDVEKIERTMVPLVYSVHHGKSQSMPNPLGGPGASVHIIALPLGWASGEGLLVAGSHRAGFSSEADLLLLRVGANQAAMAIQHHRAQRASRLAHERLVLGVRGSRIGVWEIDFPERDFRNGQVDFTNVFELLGYETPPVGRDYQSRMTLVHPADQARFERALGDYLSETTSALEIEHRALHRDGSHRWMLTRGEAVRDAQGRPIRLIGSSIDITNQKRAEEALRTSEERFRSYFQLGLVGMAITSPTKGVLEVNDEFCRILGYSREELLKKTWAEMTHPDDLAADVASFERVVAGEIDSYTLDKRWIRKDGSIVDSIISVRCFRAPDRSVDYFVALLQDVTHGKRAEAAVRESEARFRGTFDNAAIGIAHIDAEGRYVRVNERYCQIVDRSRSQLLQMTFKDVTHPDDLPRNLELYNRLMRGEIPSFSMEKRYRRADGRSVWTLLTVSLQPATARPAYSISIVEDISAAKRLEEDLRRAKDAAEAANRAKDEFLANVSHEIRTPMNAILGMSEVCLDTALTQAQRRDLNTIKGSAEALLGIVNDLLDLSKMGAGKLELASINFELRSLLDEISGALALRADKKGLKLSLRVDDDVPNGLIGDSGRLRQVLVNLLGNAIKFTETGEVSIRVHLSDSASQELSSDSVNLRFEVSDTGIGIPTDRIQRIFVAFEQADTVTARRYGGTGLGLSISSGLVEMMGGRITVDSEVGRGSTFRFTVPFGRRPWGPQSQDQPQAVPARHAAHAALASQSRRLRVLVAEDDEFSHEVAPRLLQNKGHTVTLVRDGRQALAALETGEFDLLLLDCHMPVMDGFEVVAELRQREQATGGHLPVIALTALSMKGDRERCLAAGMDDYLAKPIRVVEFYETINRVTKRHLPIRAAEPDLIDARTLLAACGGNPHLLEKMVQSFQDHVPDHLAQLTDAWRQRNAERLRSAGHKLRGLVSTFSSKVASTVQSLERTGLEQQWPSDDKRIKRVSDGVLALIEALPQVTIEELERSVEA